MAFYHSLLVVQHQFFWVSWIWTQRRGMINEVYVRFTYFWVFSLSWGNLDMEYSNTSINVLKSCILRKYSELNRVWDFEKSSKILHWYTFFFFYFFLYQLIFFQSTWPISRSRKFKYIWYFSLTALESISKV